MTKEYRIVLPLEVWGDFEDDEDLDYLHDYWKAAKVEEMQ